MKPENPKDKKQQSQEMHHGMKAIWRHLQPFKGKLILLVFLGIISAVSNGFVPYITGRFFDALIKVSEHAKNVASNGAASVTGLAANSWPLWLTLLIIWAVIQIVANNIDWIIDRVRRRVETGLMFNIQADGFIHMFRLPLKYHKNAHTNGELQKFSQASWRVPTITGTVISIAPQFVSIVIGILLAASINVVLASILFAGVVLYVLLLIKILAPIAAIDSKAHHEWNTGWDDAAASVQQVESVKQASAEEYEIKKVRYNLLSKTQNLWMKLERNWSNVSFFQRTIVFLTQLAIFVMSVKLISAGSITVGELVALNGYSLMFFGPFVALGSSWQVIQNGIITAAKAETVFEKHQEVYTPEGAVSPEHISGDVRFDNVYFRYGEGQPNVLAGMNIEVRPGQVVALVGESGVGKSTAISLISGYYFPSEGNVLIDGIDTRKLDLIKLRQHIAVVPQEVALFNDTIMTNIRYGTFGASDEDVLRVSGEAHMDEFISALPDKYKTLVGERGIKLSVGQKQRVAIARAMLREPAILILDEPTSALDAQTEKIVTEALERLMRGRTTFIIAHRLSTVRKADLILVFQKGTVVETGTHAELIAKENGVYRRLYEYQIGLH